MFLNLKRYHFEVKANEIFFRTIRENRVLVLLFEQALADSFKTLKVDNKDIILFLKLAKTGN